MFKKAASILLALAMAFSIPLSISAQEDDDDSTYVFEANEYMEEEDPAIRKAGIEMRANFVKRMTSFDITLDSRKKYTAIELFNAIYNQARVHTGQGQEGDYLYRHIAKSGGLAKRKIEGEGDNAVYHYTVTFKMEYLTDAAQESELAKSIANACKEMNLEGKSDAGKVKAIFSYLAKHVKPIQDPEDPLADSAYSALVLGKASSQGFATLLYRMLLENGIDCRVVEGEYNKTQETWDIVKVQDAYYFVDAYLDAGKETPGYLLKGTESFADHSLDDNFKTEEFTSLYPISEKDFPIEEEPEPAYQLDHEAITLAVGETATLVPSWGGYISWVSTNAGIASVSNGLVKAIAPGTVDIIAYQGKIQARCTITVTEPAHPVFGFATIEGKKYWYEDNVRQGDMNDPKNIIDKQEGYIRGREIYDPESNAWYWLDAIYDGAAAFSKEVWMPYIFQEEEPGSTNGKWVRYNDKGKMIKGWYTVTGEDAKIYPSQNGNTYYYDLITGEMLKGEQAIDNNSYHFDELTGILLP